MRNLIYSLLIVTSLTIKAQTVSTFSFNINGVAPVGLVSVLNSAAQRWSYYLNIPIPIKVNIFFVNSSLLPFSAITLANGRTNFIGAPYSNYIYTTALANQIAGNELNPGEFDMDIYINLATNYYFGTGKPSIGQSDFMSTIMHEIGHGLGFYSSGYVNASSIGSFGNVPVSALAPLTTSFSWHGQDGFPSIYDKYIIKQSHNNLVGIAANNSLILGDSIKYRSNYFDGPVFANSSNASQPVKLSGGAGAYTLGVDLLHIHSSVCNSIMSYCWGSGDTVRKPAAWEMGILKEIGWHNNIISIREHDLINDINIFPNPSSNYIEISAQHISRVEIFDIQGQIIKSQNNLVNKNLLNLNLTEMANGVYFVKVFFENEQQSIPKKIIIIN